MEHREYISIRRSYNLVRQDLDSSRRLTFQELAALCRLYNSKSGLKTSDIAAYQGCLRPTMTHRTKHLEQLGSLLCDCVYSLRRYNGLYGRGKLVENLLRYHRRDSLRSLVAALVAACVLQKPLSHLCERTEIHNESPFIQ